MHIKEFKRYKAGCAPTALTYVSKCAAETVLNLCKLNNWTDERGMYDSEWLNVAKNLGLRLEKVTLGASKEVRLERFINQHKTGTYLVTTHDHIMVVSMGVLVDPTINEVTLRRVVKAAWLVL